MQKGVLVAVVAFAAGLMGYFAAAGLPGPKVLKEDVPGLLWPNPKYLQDFQLSADSGESFGLAKLKGHWNFLFFGYTYCPDICPATLATMADVKRRLGEAREKVDDVQVVFVSVDPERDRPERLQSYVDYFDPSFIGVTGTLDSIDHFTRQIGVLHVRQTPDENGSYEVDHSVTLLVIDPKGRLVGVLRPPFESDALAAEFPKLRRFVEDHS